MKKLVWAMLVLLLCARTASAFECSFTEDMAVRQISNDRLIWRGGTSDTVLGIKRVATGGVRFRGRTAGDFSIYGVVSPAGTALVVGYNAEYFVHLASQGHCVGMSDLPELEDVMPSGFDIFLKFGAVDCVSSGENTGVRALRGGVVDLDDGSVSDIAVMRQPLENDSYFFKVAKRLDVAGIMIERNRVLFINLKKDKAHNKDMCE